jgi:hypothetical protein
VLGVEKDVVLTPIMHDTPIAMSKVWANGLAIAVAAALSLYFVLRLMLGIPETKPGIGYPKDWENQARWKGGWKRTRKSRNAGSRACASLRNQYQHPCMYRKLKPERNDGEAHRGLGVNE